MQYHLNGFRAGDPHRVPHSDRTELDGTVDVLIVGCGPAGLTLAAQLCAFDDLRIRIIERKSGPLTVGQADGIACRSVEMFEAFGFSERVIREAYDVRETVFWGPDKRDPTSIIRSGRLQDVEDDLSEFPHLIINQARVHDFYLDRMRHSSHRLQPDYDCHFTGMKISEDNQWVNVSVEKQTTAEQVSEETIRARFVVGCDGARSSVRAAMGLALSGDSANQAWGVMDVLAVSDFPDIRFKTVVRSASEGNLLIIPREGGYLVRFYIELDKLDSNERVADRNITSTDLVEAANRILAPYTLDVREIAWWSVYQIGQRLCDRFDNLDKDATKSDVPRVFIAGDACHTHSPKAGQGMNVSMADAFNLGWKLASVIRGQSQPDLLRSYSSERQLIAKDLIDFDRQWAARFGETTREDDESTQNSMSAAEFQQYFSEHGRYTAGMSVHYSDPLLTATDEYQSLAKGFVIGERFHSALVTRVCDALPMQLAHTIKADGRWRLFAFADAESPNNQSSKLWQLCDYLSTDTRSPMRAFQSADADPDFIIDLRAIAQQPHQELDTHQFHTFLVPIKGRLKLQDREKVYIARVATDMDIYQKRGVSADGCLIIVRPDQYIADVMPLDDYARLRAYFERILIPV